MSESPLIITADETLLDHALTAVVAAGAEPMVARDVATALPSWREASIVLLGVDQAPALVSRRPYPTRPVHLLGDHHDREELCTLSAQLSAAVVVLPEQRSALTGTVREYLSGGGRGRLMAVRAATGGLGASTVATGLAWRMHGAGTSTVLVDLDPYGGGLDLAIGLESEPGWRWPQLADVTGRVSDVTARLPRLEGLPVLSIARDQPGVLGGAAGVMEVLDSCLQDHEWVLADLGRELDATIASEVLARARPALLLVRDDVRGVAAAAALVARAGDEVEWCTVLCRGPVAGLPADAVAEALDREVAVTLPYDRSVRTALVRGEPPGPGTGRAWRRRIDQLVGRVTA